MYLPHDFVTRTFAFTNSMLKIIVNEKQKQFWKKFSIYMSKIYTTVIAVC
jgi:hypothetical protein